MEAQLLSIQQKADIQDMAKEALEEELVNLEKESLQSEDNVNVAMRKASEADPGVEELTKWFKESKLLMSKLLNVASIRLLKGMTLEVVYLIEGSQKRTLLVKMAKGAVESNKGRDSWTISNAEVIYSFLTTLTYFEWN